MRLDPETLVNNVTELLADVDDVVKLGRIRRRAPGYFMKAGDDEPGPVLRAVRRRLRGGADGGDEAAVHAHAEAKATHHEKMAELYNATSSRHARIAAHYQGGAKGAYKDGDSDSDDAKRQLHEDEGDTEPLEARVRKALAAGDLDRLVDLVSDGKGLVALRARADRGDIAAADFLETLGKAAVHRAFSRPRYDDCGGAGYRALAEAERRLGWRSK